MDRRRDRLALTGCDHAIHEIGCSDIACQGRNPRARIVQLLRGFLEQLAIEIAEQNIAPTILDQSLGAGRANTARAFRDRGATKLTVE